MRKGPKPIPVVDRFWPNVEKTDDCWIWTGRRAGSGSPYGNITTGRTASVYAHRFSYELHRGEIPDGLEIDHLCFNTLCVNPDHLEAVTHRENMRRGRHFIGEKARQTHCVNGHPFDEQNTRRRKNGTRQCRACAREWRRKKAA